MSKQRISTRIRKYWLILMPVVTVSVCAAEPVKLSVKGELVRIDELRVLRVWGSPSERGFAHGYLLATDIVSLLDGYLSSLGSGSGTMGYTSAMLPMAKRMHVAPVYESELRGMLAGIEARLKGATQVPVLARPIGYADLVAINSIPDLSRLGCSSFAVWGRMTADGETIVGRNLDWNMLDALVGSQVVVAYLASPESKGLGWVSLTWPGYIGCLTGMNAEGVTVSMHDVRADRPSVMDDFVPRGLALREAIESARAVSAFQDVKRVLQSRRCAVGNNVPVTIPSAGKGPSATVFEYDGVLTLTKGVTVWPPDNESYQVCTNHYRKRAAPINCDRYEKIESKLAELAAGHRLLDVAGAWSILQAVSRPGGKTGQVLTYQGVIFQPNARRMHVAFFDGRRAAPYSKAVPLLVDDLLADGVTSGSVVQPERAASP